MTDPRLSPAPILHNRDHSRDEWLFDFFKRPPQVQRTVTRTLQQHRADQVPLHTYRGRRPSPQGAHVSWSPIAYAAWLTLRQPERTDLLGSGSLDVLCPPVWNLPDTTPPGTTERAWVALARTAAASGMPHPRLNPVLPLTEADLAATAQLCGYLQASRWGRQHGGARLDLALAQFLADPLVADFPAARLAVIRGLPAPAQVAVFQALPRLAATVRKEELTDVVATPLARRRYRS